VDQIIRIGMDTSKYIFQLHGVDGAEQPVLRKRLRRKEMMAFFAALPPTVIGIEACGSRRKAGTTADDDLRSNLQYAAATRRGLFRLVFRA
jgi:transposase